MDTDFKNWGSLQLQLDPQNLEEIRRTKECPKGLKLTTQRCS